RKSSAPDGSRLAVAARRQRPDEFERPIHRLALCGRGLWRIVRRLFRILRRGDFIPCGAAVAGTVHFDSEVSMIQCGEKTSVSWVMHDERAVVAKKARLAYGPAGRAALESKQTFSRCHVASNVHRDPPDNACMMSTTASHATGSLRPSRS